VLIIRYSQDPRFLRASAAGSMRRGHPTRGSASRWTALAGVALFAVVLAGPVCAKVPAEDVDAALDRVFDAGDYQRDLPLPVASEEDGGRGDDPMADPDWWRNEGDSQAPDLYRPRARGSESTAFSFEIPPALREVLRVLMWIVFVAGGALVGYYLLNEARLFSRWKKSAWQTENGPVDTAADGSAIGAGVLDDPESLAARGDYAEAVHVLLLRSIALIRDRGAALSSSLTSREIVRRAPFGVPERDAFRALVDVTELTHFGGRAATEEDFRTCRDLFERIARAAAGGAG